MSEDKTSSGMTPEEFGEFIKGEREVRFLSHSDIERVTKVRKSFIESIEKGDFGALPHRIFARGFVRALSSFMKLDDSDVLSKFDMAADSFWGVKEQESTVKRVKKHFPWFYVLMGSMVVILIIAMFIYIPIFYRSKNKTKITLPEKIVTLKDLK